MSMRSIVVHGVEIPESLLALEAQNHPSLSAAEARAAAGHALATKALLLHRAAELGLEPELECDEDGREETPEAAQVRAVLEAEIDVTAPTDAECLRVYEAQRERFRSPSLYEASHILIEPRSASAQDDTSAQLAAVRLCEDLAQEPGRFAELARMHSDCPSKSVGGSLGQLGPGDLVAEVERALLRLKPGRIAAAPLRSRLGWHVLKLERRSPERDLPFDIVADRIRLHLESRSWSAAAARYVLALAEKAKGQGGPIALNDAGALAGGAGCLGDFVGDGAAAERLLPWLDIVDADLGGRVRAAAAARNADPQAFVRAAVAEFVGHADDEQWTQLISAARDGADPALGALSAILKLTLRPVRPAVTVFPRQAKG